MERRHFAVIGLGKFGFYLARNLVEHDQHVLCVEKDEALVEAISPYVNEAVVGDASKREVLEGLGLTDMEQVIVAVGNLTQSVLITLYLKELGVKKVLAKANDEDHAKVLSLVGADRVIIPERDSARRVAQSLVMPNIVDFLPMMPDFCIAEIDPPPSFIGHSLAELDLRRRYHVYVIGTRSRFSDKINLMPKAEHIIDKDEILYVLGRRIDVENLS
ncbi:potassium channel family protein [Thermosulfuriphilus sp.]